MILSVVAGYDQWSYPATTKAPKGDNSIRNAQILEFQNI